MNLETEVKKLLEEGYSENDILKACERMKGESHG